jgi:osmoprotectant transport system substrate-binding protein
MRKVFAVCLLLATLCVVSCHNQEQKKLIIGSKFFTEQVVLAELLAQHIEACAGVPVERKSNLGGTLLVHKAMLNGNLDLYVEYTGTALLAVLGEPATGDSKTVYSRVRDEYAKRFNLEVTEPLGFENTFAMVVRKEDADQYHLAKISDIVPLAPQWRPGVGYEFLERADGYKGWTERYGLKFGKAPSELDLGLLYRALVEKKVDVVAGNSTDGLIESLHLVPLEDNLRYFPPYDAVPVVRRDALERIPGLHACLAQLGGKISVQDMRRMNFEVDGDQRDVATVVREFRAAKGL